MAKKEAKKQIVYISGPMRGILERDSRAAFDQAYTLLEAQGYAPVDPWDLHDALPMFGDKQMLDIDMAVVRNCDAIYMLRGWRDSVGANMEMGEFVVSKGSDGILFEMEEG